MYLPQNMTEYLFLSDFNAGMEDTSVKKLQFHQHDK